MKELQSKHYTIAIMTGDTQSDYSEEIMRGFYTSAQEEGVNIVLFLGPQMPTYCADIVNGGMRGDYRSQFNTIYQYAHFLKPDAIIIAYGSLSTFNYEQSKQNFFELFADTPRLIIEDKSLNDDVPYLATDNYSGMRACVEHLIVDHGYKNIAFLGGPKGNYDSEDRLRAYRDVMQVNGLEVADTMVVHGDYTDHVEDQVNYLLDNNPGLEAIVSANDGMAKSVYRVCAARNLIVGTDIAVTGFDDTLSASTMNPPLTSVFQNSFQIGYTALKEAVAMCGGYKPVSGTVPTILKKRCSCGCTPVNALEAVYVPESEMAAYIEKAITDVSEYMFESISYLQDREYMTRALADYFHYIYNTLFLGDGENFFMDNLLDILKVMASYPHLPNELLLKNITGVLQILLANARDAHSQEVIASIISASQQFVHSFNIEKLEKEIFASNRKSWFVPTFTSELVRETYMNRPQDIFESIMSELKKMAVRSAYFFFFDKPIIHTFSEVLHFPEHMNLVAYFDSEEMKFFRKKEQLKFGKERGFASFIDGKDASCFTPVILFSENKQYGVMFCEVDYSDIPFLQICSVQLGTLFHFIELNMLEQQAQEDLQESMRVIKEQNTILSYISEYDELTKLLNRRGFIEKALALYKKSAGRRAYMIFGDLDHLKQINDIYGHAEGDFAIKTIAERFRTILPGNTISGRIGGDEYVSFLPTDEVGFKERIADEFMEAGRIFNENSDKPYYVEMSVGIYEFVCDSEVSFEEIMKQSDNLLYEAKANRRTNVQKEPS